MLFFSAISKIFIIQQKVKDRLKDRDNTTVVWIQKVEIHLQATKKRKMSTDEQHHIRQDQTNCERLTWFLSGLLKECLEQFNFV